MKVDRKSGVGKRPLAVSSSFLVVKGLIWRMGDVGSLWLSFDDPWQDVGLVSAKSRGQKGCASSAANAGRVTGVGQGAGLRGRRLALF